MTIADNKRLVEKLFSRFSQGDLSGIMELFADDATWRLPGKPELLPVAGVYDKQRLEKLFSRMLKQLPDGLKMSVLGLVAEGDKVAAEAESRGDLKNGRQYRQQYHLLFELRDGKIAAVREYLDTQHAFEVWVRP